MLDAPSPLNDTAFMTAFLDTLIPPSADGKLPGAGALGLGPQVAGAIRSNPKLCAEVEAGLEEVRAGDFEALDLQGRVDAIEAALEAHPKLIRYVTTPLYFAYYQHATVLSGLGLPARPPFPGGFEVEATDPKLLDLLRTRAKS